MRHLMCWGIISSCAILFVGCADCGDGSGIPVEFCRQVDEYYGGDPLRDSMKVECIVGPLFGSVYESRNGTYYCSGTYKLGSKDSATIELCWGGTTTFTMYQDFEITSPGEGTFSVAVKKVRGGSGNLFLSMTSQHQRLLDVVPVNSLCDEARSLELIKNEELEDTWTANPVQSLINTDVFVPYRYEIAQ